MKEEKAEKAKEVKPKAPKEKNETKYAVEELEKAAIKLFGVQPECVRAAFSFAGKSEASETEAKKIVKEFMIREVK
ncbi:MAG: hypothetical protein HFE62_05050 [Firmicutes bacterium]|nr:hypothetical protein [Bacillota bacterium]